MNRLFMRDSQSCATLSNHRPHTPNEQVSGSSPLVGSLFYLQIPQKQKATDVRIRDLVSSSCSNSFVHRKGVS